MNIIRHLSWRQYDRGWNLGCRIVTVYIGLSSEYLIPSFGWMLDGYLIRFNSALKYLRPILSIQFIFVVEELFILLACIAVNVGLKVNFFGIRNGRNLKKGPINSSPTACSFNLAPSPYTLARNVDFRFITFL